MLLVAFPYGYTGEHHNLSRHSLKKIRCMLKRKGVIYFLLNRALTALEQALLLRSLRKICAYLSVFLQKILNLAGLSVRPLHRWLGGPRPITAAAAAHLPTRSCRRWTPAACCTRRSAPLTPCSTKKICKAPRPYDAPEPATGACVARKQGRRQRPTGNSSLTKTRYVPYIRYNRRMEYGRVFFFIIFFLPQHVSLLRNVSIGSTRSNDLSMAAASAYLAGGCLGLVLRFQSKPKHKRRTPHSRLTKTM